MDMKLKRIFGFIPVPVFYVEKIGSEDFPAGRSHGFFVLIRKMYRDDKGLLAHELKHCEQNYRCLWLPFLILYTISDKFRYKMELEAYRKQLTYAIDETDRLRLINKFSWFLCNRYDIKNLDQEKVKKDLS